MFGAIKVDLSLHIKRRSMVGHFSEYITSFELDLHKYQNNNASNEKLINAPSLIHPSFLVEKKHIRVIKWPAIYIDFFM